MLQTLSLGVAQGEQLVLEAIGEDADAVLDELVELFASRFGDDEPSLKDHAWFKGNAPDAGENYAHAVGTKLPNAWGLYDTHGNVWEWCQDWYERHPDRTQMDPRGPASGVHRVARGGGFTLDAGYSRSTIRCNGRPDMRSSVFGFRPARSLP